MTDATTKQAPAELSPWMTFADVQERYGASRSWVYIAIERGDLPKPVSMGNKRFFSRAAVNTLDARRLADAEGAARA